MIDAAASPARIVLHVSDRAEDLARAATTASLLREAYPGADVRVIVNGPALA
jgi:intracellular sulfur oxidation DsrE/DsrF family protein